MPFYRLSSYYKARQLPSAAALSLTPTRLSIASSIPRGYGIFPETKLLDTVVDTAYFSLLGHEPAYIIQKNLSRLKRAQ